MGSLNKINYYIVYFFVMNFVMDIFFFKIWNKCIRFDSVIVIEGLGCVYDRCMFILFV